VDGKIVNATCEVGDQEKLETILNTDEGARYIGEFAFGFHPMIEKAVGEVLFDEKVRGSFHFTPGKAYQVADNGNVSNIH
jgi:aminopeptidase